MGGKLRIVMTADPDLPVPPQLYGGIERIVSMLVGGLAQRGHEIHLLAHPDSKVPADLAPLDVQRSFADSVRNAGKIHRLVSKLGHVDVIHSFGRLAYLLLVLRMPMPKIQSYQRHVTPRSVFLANLIAGRRIRYVACSRACLHTPYTRKQPWSFIPNGVPLERYPFAAQVSPDAPLVFLGRVERIKGAHTAIEVAKKTGRKLLIAGNHASSGKEHEYFQKEIFPYCGKNGIEYVGPVDDEQKAHLLGQAAALLFPIEWEEPFGIVMAEALACGTPVLAFARGSVPEVIDQGSTGFICQSSQEMTEAVEKIPAIHRAACRHAAQQRFSQKCIVDQYEALYHAAVEDMNLQRG